MGQQDEKGTTPPGLGMKRILISYFQKTQKPQQCGFYNLK